MAGFRKERSVIQIHLIKEMYDGAIISPEKLKRVISDRPFTKTIHYGFVRSP